MIFLLGFLGLTWHSEVLAAELTSERLPRSSFGFPGLEK
jgi:hypothetical protein